MKGLTIAMKIAIKGLNNSKGMGQVASTAGELRRRLQS
jgi:hypothetical protein